MRSSAIRRARRPEGHGDGVVRRVAPTGIALRRRLIGWGRVPHRAGQRGLTSRDQEHYDSHRGHDLPTEPQRELSHR
jgi:hypothetical protein